MSNQRKRSAFGQFVDLFGSAIAVAAAVDAGRRPRDRDLRVLGIDASNFRNIQRR
jgi:hypothetical protein